MKQSTLFKVASGSIMNAKSSDITLQASDMLWPLLLQCLRMMSALIHQLSSFLLKITVCSFAVSLLKTNFQRGHWNKERAKLATIVIMSFLLESAVILILLSRLIGVHAL